MGRRKPRNIKIREDRLSKIDGTKMEVAIWLLAKGKVEDRTQRSQPAPPASDEVNNLQLMTWWGCRAPIRRRPRDDARRFWAAWCWRLAAALVTLLVSRKRQSPVMESVELRFGVDVSENAVWGVLGCISGLPTAARRWCWSLSVMPTVFAIICAPSLGTIGILRAHLRGLLPGVRLEPVEPATPTYMASGGAAALGWSSPAAAQ